MSTKLISQGNYTNSHSACFYRLLVFPPKADISHTINSIIWEYMYINFVFLELLDILML